jgi:hypothetical protein
MKQLDKNVIELLPYCTLDNRFKLVHPSGLVLDLNDYTGNMAWFNDECISLGWSCWGAIRKTSRKRIKEHMDAKHKRVASALHKAIVKEETK